MWGGVGKVSFTLIFALALIIQSISGYAEEPYGRLSEDGETVTFFFDNNKKEGDLGFDFAYTPGWTRAKVAIFHESFQRYTPKSCKRWFNFCEQLTEIKHLDYLNTSQVTDMSAMFQGCQKLEELDLSNFDNSNLTDISAMFFMCINLTTIYVSDKWITTKGYKYEMTFFSCYKLFGGKGSLYCDNNNGSFARIDGGKDNPGYFTRKGETKARITSISVTTKPTQTDYILGEKLNTDGGEISVEFEGREAQLHNFDGVTVTGYDNSKTGKQILTAEFLGATTTAYEVEVTSKETNYAIFDVTNGILTFYYGTYRNGSVFCDNPYSYPYDNKKNVRKIILDKSFQTNKPTNLSSWFSNYQNMTEIVGIENINTQDVTDMSSMFESCHNLKTIYVGDNWSTEKVKYSGYMFSGCTSLVGGNGTKYDATHTDAEYAIIDGTNGLPGYFTAKNSIFVNKDQDNNIVADLFDNGLTTTIESNTTVDKVEVHREIGNEASTIILPFDMTVADALNGITNMNGYEFYEFTGVKKVNGKWTANYSQVEKIEANKPYIVKNVEANDLVFNGGNGNIILEPLAEGENTVSSATDESAKGWEFVGSYEKIVWTENSQNEYGFAANDEGDDVKAGDFVRIGAGATLKPMRGYMRYTKDDNPFTTKAGEQLPDHIEVVLIPLGSVNNPNNPNENPGSGNIETPVSETAPDGNGVKVWSFNKTIIIESQPDAEYTIADMSGRIIKTGVTHSTREEVTLGHSTGIVIVNINGKSFKINY